MMTVLALSLGAVAIVSAAALALPCEACRLRRERMKRAYEAWRAAHPHK